MRHPWWSCAVFVVAVLLWFEPIRARLQDAALTAWDWLAALMRREFPDPWAWRQKRDRRRLVAGLCPRCGYDLRGSPNRCPECGTERDAEFN